MTKRQPTIFEDVYLAPNGVYYYRGTPPVEGSHKQIEVSLKTKNEDEVKFLRQRLFAEIEQVGLAAKTKKVAPLMRMYLAERYEQVNPRKGTKAIRPRYFQLIKDMIDNYLLPYFGNMTLDKIKPKEFDRFCEKYGHRDYQNQRKVLSHFLGWCQHQELLKTVPEFKLPLWNKRKRMVLTEDEIMALFTHCDDEDLLLYISMYLFLGMRNSEIILLEWDRVDLDRRSLMLREVDTKTGRRRELPMNDFITGQLLQRKLKAVGPYVFPGGSVKGARTHRGRSSFVRPWDRLLERAKIERELTPHDLRATFETYASKKSNFTDTQREMMAGAEMKLQKGTYISMSAEDLRGLEESVSFPQLVGWMGKKDKNS